jgi:hypothetical protein
MGHKISRKRRRHIRRKRTLKRGGNPFLNFFRSRLKPKFPNSPSDFEPTDDTYEDMHGRPTEVEQDDESNGHRDHVSEAERDDFNNNLNESFVFKKGGRRMTRRKRRTKRKSRF